MTTLPDPVDQVRIRPGQRKLIFAVAARLGLRDEQLHDLVECASDYRTRAIARLTIGEARRLTGTLKTMERNAAAPPGAGPAAAVPEAIVRRAVQRAAAPRSA